MQTGNCFKSCSLKGKGVGSNVPVDFTADLDSPPDIPCRCGGGLCAVRTSKTEKNPGRRFYTCPADCGFFKWYDKPNDKRSILLRPSSSIPNCPCGSGPCRRLTVTSGPDVGRSYFVCGIKKSFGACAFFQWEDAQIPSECAEEERHRSYSASAGDEKKSFRLEPKLISENWSSSLEADVKETSNPAMEAALLKPFEENETYHCDSITVNEVPVEMEELNLLHSRSISLEIEEEGLKDKKLEEELSMEPPCDDDDDLTELSTMVDEESTITETKSDHIHQDAVFMDLIDKYNSDKVNFENVSVRCVDAFSAFVDSYRQLKSLHEKACRLRKLLVRTEKEVACCEAETLEFAASVREVYSEMNESQKTIQETTERLAEEIEVFKLRA